MMEEDSVCLQRRIDEAHAHLRAHKAGRPNPLEETYKSWEGNRYTQILMDVGYCVKGYGGAWPAHAVGVQITDPDTSEVWTVICRK